MQSAHVPSQTQRHHTCSNKRIMLNTKCSEAPLVSGYSYGFYLASSRIRSAAKLHLFRDTLTVSILRHPELVSGSPEVPPSIPLPQGQAL